MDLELALGHPLGDMPESEFRRWREYARRKALPQRRMELYYAQIAMHVAISGGSTKTSLRDYLFDPPDETQGNQRPFDEDHEFNP